MKEQDRKIALVVDNCSAHHTNKSFTNIQLFFLPPCVTATHQPCDAGIIALLKGRYRRLFLRLVYDLDIKEYKSLNSISYAQCLQNLNSAWQSIKPTLLENCFRHAWEPGKEGSIPSEAEISTNGGTNTTEPDVFVDANIPRMQFLAEDNLVVEPEADKEIVQSIRREQLEKETTEASDELESPSTATSNNDNTQVPSAEDLGKAASILLSALDLGMIHGDDENNLSQMRKLIQTMQRKAEALPESPDSSPKRSLQPTLDFFSSGNDETIQMKPDESSDPV